MQFWYNLLHRTQCVQYISGYLFIAELVSLRSTGGYKCFFCYRKVHHKLCLSNTRYIKCCGFHGPLVLKLFEFWMCSHLFFYQVAKKQKVANCEFHGFHNSLLIALFASSQPRWLLNPMEAAQGIIYTTSSCLITSRPQAQKIKPGSGYCCFWRQMVLDTCLGIGISK